jgi:chaperone BCS1
LPPPVEEHLTACQHSAKPLDGARLAQLAKMFADSIPDDEFSVAALQGCEFLLILWRPLCFDAPFHRALLGLLWAGW